MRLPTISIKKFYRYEVDRFGNSCTIDRDNVVKYWSPDGDLLNQFQISNHITNRIRINKGRLYYNVKEVDEGMSLRFHIKIVDLITEQIIKEWKDLSIYNILSKGILVKNIEKQLCFLDFDSLEINWEIDLYSNKFALEDESDLSIYCYSIMDRGVLKKIGIEDGKEIWRFSISELNHNELANERFKNYDWYLHNDLLYVNLKSGNLLVLNSKNGSFVKYINTICGSNSFYIHTTKGIALKLCELGLVKVNLDNEQMDVQKFNFSTKVNDIRLISYTDELICFMHTATNIIYIIDLESLEIKSIHDDYKIDSSKGIKHMYLDEGFLFVMYGNESLDIFKFSSKINSNLV